MGCKNLKKQRREIFQNLLDNRVSNNILSTSRKKEDIKMDDQIKIKILKYFHHGLQKPFSKNKEERFSPNIWFIEGLRPPFRTPFGPLSDPFRTPLSKIFLSKKGRYKNGCSNKNKNSKKK